MKASFLACLAVLALSVVATRAGNINVTVVTNPPQGGTVTGAGIYPSRSSVFVAAQASNGWYIANVTLNGSTAAVFAVKQALLVDAGGDLTVPASTNT